MARRKTDPALLETRPPMDDDPVVKGLLKAISLRRIRPGTKLVADQLVEAFGSNRIHIRQVFEHLSSRNIIRLYPNRGAYIAEPTAEEARQVFATRRVLERAVVLDLIERLDEKSAVVLRSHMDHAVDHKAEDRWGTLTRTGEFHGLLAALAGNTVSARFVDELVLRTSLIIATFERHGGDDDCSPDAHPGIAERILAGDREGAVAAMEAHLEAMEERLHFEVQPPPQKLTTIFAELGVKKRSRRTG